jgi:hypothetical protein
MVDKHISTAKRRAQRSRLKGKKTGEFDFDFITDIESLEEYYDVGLSKKKIERLVSEYKEINYDVYEQFLEKTRMTKGDISFLFLAVGLQVVRQYFVTDFKERMNDQATARKTKGHTKEHSMRSHRYYKPTLEEIITNPVPFDANIGSNGVLKGGGILGHRATAIGHDPILGLIFGTANIATSTLTNSSFKSYHIATNENKRDYFRNNAKTSKVLEETKNKLLDEGIEGKTIVASSLIKEVIHLKSDINSKKSLPLPFLSAFDPKLASELAKYKIDMGNLVNVGKQASGAVLINTIIGMLHRLMYDPEIHGEKKLHEVRTRKILMYSNAIATASNLFYVACTNDVKKLDIGGLIVTVHRIVTDEKFIRQVMHEFIDTNVSSVYSKELSLVNEEYEKLCVELGYQ